MSFLFFQHLFVRFNLHQLDFFNPRNGFYRHKGVILYPLCRQHLFYRFRSCFQQFCNLCNCFLSVFHLARNDSNRRSYTFSCKDTSFPIQNFSSYCLCSGNSYFICRSQIRKNHGIIPNQLISIFAL